MGRWARRRRRASCTWSTTWTNSSRGYCHWFAARAVEIGCAALTVLGGDKAVGAPRCVSHGYLLRQQIRERFADLALGGWANPHRDARRQVGFLAADSFCADFYLTQIVSHHHLDVVDAFLDEVRLQGVETPGVWGVFFYRSANPRTLSRLSAFMEVPMEALQAEFASGLKPAEICARSIAALAARGVRNVYVSNLHPEHALRQLQAIRAALARL